MTDLDLSVRPSSAAFAGGPLLMLFLCICGMAVGLAIDCGSVPLELLASLCLAGSARLVSGVGLHLELLPATHALMLVGAVLAVAMMHAARPRAARSPRTLLAHCLPDAAVAAAMLVGMVVGGQFAPPLAELLGIGSSSAQLVTGMVLGMTLGMIVAAPLYRGLTRTDLAEPQRRARPAAMSSSRPMPHAPPTSTSARR